MARHHPVGAAFNHRLQARATPCGEKLGIVHGFQSIVAQCFTGSAGFVHADKPLRCGAVNQWGFVPPAVCIAVFDFGVGEQAAVFFQPLDNGIIALFEHVHAGQARHFTDVAALRVHGVVQFDAVLVAHDIVFQAVRGCGVHQARTCVCGNVAAVEHDDFAFQKRVFEFQVFQ